MRLALLSFLAACSTASATQTPPNLVCARVAIVNPKASCQPELTDVGDRHTHRAIVATGDNKAACALNDSTLALVCDGLVATPKQPAPEQKAPAP